VKRSRASKRYAQALFKEGKEKNKLDFLKEDLVHLGKIYAESDEFRKLINSPVIPKEIKKKSFADAFKDILDPLTYNFVVLLIESSREELLSDVIDNFSRALDDYYGILRGKVFSVTSLSVEQLDSLKKKLDKMTDKDVILSQETDKSILGGFIVKINDRIIDASLRNQLAKMGEYLVE